MVGHEGRRLTVAPNARVGQNGVTQSEPGLTEG